MTPPPPRVPDIEISVVIPEGGLRPVPARRYDPDMDTPPESRVDRWLRRAMVIAGMLCLLVWASVAMLVVWQHTCGMGAPC